MSSQSLNRWNALKPFDPEQGKVVVKPLGDGEGYWVGACGIVFDPSDETYYLYYRAREPRPVRGGKCFVAQSIQCASQTMFRPNTKKLEHCIFGG